MDTQSQPPCPALEALQRAFLAEALQEVLGSSSDEMEAAGCDARSLEVLRETAQVADALQLLQLGAEGTAPTDQGVHSAALASLDPSEASAFAGAPGSALGVSAADLLEEALPPEGERQRALAAALPALEAALQRRCADVAAACGYGASDCSGLPDYIAQLQEAGLQQRAEQAELHRRAAAQAEEALGLLGRAAQLLADIIERHKLRGRKAADEAHAAALSAQCIFLREKLRVVELQLQEATYSAATVPVLLQVGAEVERSLAEAAAQLQQASARLARYRQLGPAFAALADEYGAVLEALEEAEFELRELEQFQTLAAVTG
ncbi:hypothetical protein ABPG77_010967 [Micractinium sp. CCAP 211/92]